MNKLTAQKSTAAAMVMAPIWKSVKCRPSTRKLVQAAFGICIT